jgi:hypothetical protein
MANFTDCADELICATFSGSNGIVVGVLPGTPNKITASVDSTFVRTTGTQAIAGDKNFLNAVTASFVSASTANFNAVTASAMSIAGDVILTNIGGIVFGTTAGASFGSHSSNTLSDYEFGTFTPQYTNLDVDPYTVNEGRYTKIGKVVFYYIWLAVTLNPSGDPVVISGLPFTSATLAAGAAGGGTVTYITTPGWTSTLTVLLHGATTSLELFKLTNGSQPFLDSDLFPSQSYQQLSITGFYESEV